MGGPGSGSASAKRSQDLDEAILSRLSQGHTLREICRDEGISPTSVYAWEKSDQIFGERIACAREAGEKAIEDECLEIADDGSNDYVERMTAAGTTAMVYDSDHVQRSKLRIETRLKLLAVKNPAKYGTNRVDVTSKGEGLAALTETERGARIAGLLAEAEARRKREEGIDNGEG